MIFAFKLLRRHSLVSGFLFVTAFALAQPSAVKRGVPTIDEVIASKRDLWGELALRQPGGPSYEFFAGLLPPLRYVDAPFHFYPIVLSAPGAPVKARLVSNGSCLNALARQPNWRGEVGVPVTFRVGLQGETFGADLRRLEGPKYANGYLPIVQLRYRHDACDYSEESFAAVEPQQNNGLVFVRFGLEHGMQGKVTAQFESSEPLIARDGQLHGANNRAFATFDSHWHWNLARNTLIAQLRAGESAMLAVVTDPAIPELPPLLNPDVYPQARAACVQRWQSLLDAGMQVEVAEPVVNNAWRALIVGNYEMLKDEEMRYSAGNQYAHLYIAEGGDATRALMLWGHTSDACRAMGPLFDFRRVGLEFHQAALKLQMLAHYYWLTRDAESLQTMRPRFEKELNLILNGIEKASGLLPREKYCGDIDTRIYSLNANGECWRALRDMAAVLNDIGDRAEAARLAARAADYRKTVLAALEKSIRRDVTPPFIPIAMFGEEQPYDPIVGSRMGSYWNIVAQFLIATGVFPVNSEPATALLNYEQQKGGLCMGMSRSRPAPSFWVDEANINDLYGMRRTLALLERDEPDRALVSFYGKLAQGLTHDTFIGAEGTSIRPLDEFGRQMYLPPNSASNAHFLQVLRYLLIQDWDTDDDGKPDTLRLLFATPRRWLRDGAKLDVERAPTAFGECAIHLRSQLRQNVVTAEIDLPKIERKQTLLRLRLPEGWKISEVDANGHRLRVTGAETIDLEDLSGHVTITAQIRRSS